MMNRTKSARVHLIRFLFLLPLLVVVLLAFRNTTQGRQQPLPGIVTDTIPDAVGTPPGWKDMNTIDVTDEHKVTIRLKNGKTERYDLKNPKDKTAFEKKYGSLPEPPVPPTPLTASINERELPVPEAPEKPEKPEIRELAEVPEAPEKPERPEARELPEAPEAPEAPAIAAPSINLQDCLNKKGYCITVADNQGECIVIVKDKNNKIVEAVALTDWSKDKQYESKYGDIPSRQVRLAPKRVVGIKIKPVKVEKAQSVTIIDLKVQESVTAKPVTEVNVKPVTSTKINAKPADPVRLINLTPVNKAETVPFSAEKAKPIAAVNVILSNRATARVKANSRVSVVRIVSAKSAAKVQEAAEPKATQKPMPVQPDDKL